MFPSIIVFQFLLVFDLSLSRIQVDECKMSLEEMNVYTPLFRDPNGTELMPEGREPFYGLKIGETTEISCYSLANRLVGYSTKFVTGTCQTGGKIKTRKGEFALNSFSCMRPIFPMTVYKGSCNGPKRGRFIDIGYKGDNDEFVKGISVCHNREKGETYWVYYSLHPRVYRHRVKHIGIDDELKIGQVVDLYGPIVSNISDIYNNAKISMRNMPGLASDYVDDIVPGFLAPPEDFMSYNTQKMTLFYINTAPQWNTTYMENWKLIEQMIRKKYKDDPRPITILTGTYDIKSTNQDEGLWLWKRMIPYPKYLWKAIFREGKSLVFSIENGPAFRKSGTTPFSDGLSCQKRGWNFGKSSDKIACGSFKRLVSVIGENNLPHNFILKYASYKTN